MRTPIRRSRILVWLGAVVFIFVAIGSAVVKNHLHAAVVSDGIPLVQVKRGDLPINVHATAELRASHSAMLAAPPVGGGALQITELVGTGTIVKKGAVVVEFDPSEQQYKAEQSKSDLTQAEQEITKAKAGAIVLTAEDKVALLKARYGVRKAELDVKKDELLSKIDSEKNELALVQAQRVLAEVEKAIESHKTTGQASVFLAQEKYNKAKLAMDQAQQNLDKMRVVAPMDGLVSVQKNNNAAGGMYFSGMTLPDYHAGDQVQAGGAIAKVVDPMGMDLISKVSEREHSNVSVGQTVDVVFDALPDRTFRGTVKTVSGMSTRQFFDDNGGGTFDVSIELANPDDRLRSGFTAQVVFLGTTQKSVLWVARQAVFLKEGKRIVFVQSTGGYEQREIKIKNETESRAAITGLGEGTTVALIDPTVPRKSSSSNSAAVGTGGTP